MPLRTATGGNTVQLIVGCTPFTMVRSARCRSAYKAKDYPSLRRQTRNQGRRVVRQVHQLRRFHRSEHLTGGPAIPVGVVGFNTQGRGPYQNENHRNRDCHFHERKTASLEISRAEGSRDFQAIEPLRKRLGGK